MGFLDDKHRFFIKSQLTEIRENFWRHYKWPLVVSVFIHCVIAVINYSNLSLVGAIGIWVVMLLLPAVFALKYALEDGTIKARQHYWEELSPADKVRDYEKREWWLTWNERQDLKRLKQQLVDELAATQKQPE